MMNLVKGTVAAMIASVGVLGSAMTVCAAPADEVSLHMTERTCDVAEGEEAHIITDAERQKLHEQIDKSAKENQSGLDIVDVVDKAADIVDLAGEGEGIIEFIENIIDFFS